VAESDRREPVISSVIGRQLGDLPNMIQPPLLGVVNAASSLCPNLDLPGAGRAAELLDAVGVHGRTAAPVPQIVAARRERVRSLDPDIASIEREGIAAFDAASVGACARPRARRLGKSKAVAGGQGRNGGRSIG
jgi:hypothetical protein